MGRGEVKNRVRNVMGHGEGGEGISCLANPVPTQLRPLRQYKALPLCPTTETVRTE